mmetsp:Transcript_82522/g.129749  ORF Transcript_82522/g.129749 Transcript_82522/m.129749 type:complete len:208 (+) Transcript_82522:189-812(+)
MSSSDSSPFLTSLCSVVVSFGLIFSNLPTVTSMPRMLYSGLCKMAAATSELSTTMKPTAAGRYFGLSGLVRLSIPCVINTSSTFPNFEKKCCKTRLELKPSLLIFFTMITRELSNVANLCKLSRKEDTCIWKDLFSGIGLLGEHVPPMRLSFESRHAFKTAASSGDSFLRTRSNCGPMSFNAGILLLPYLSMPAHRLKLQVESDWIF